MDRLVVMKTFVTVAKSSSFSAAARELAISGSLVSRHVADLERQVGVQLVNRTARSVSLTAAGQRYSEFADRILSDIKEEDSALSESRNSPVGPLSVICPQWIGTTEVGDAIAAFARHHPQITMRVELGGMSERSYDFLDRGYDVAFHTRDLRDSNVRIRRLCELPFMLAASAEYIQARGAPSTVADLAEHERLMHLFDPVWRLNDGEEIVQYKVKDAAVVANSYLILQKLVEQGRGIALIPRRPGSAGLVEVLPQFSTQARALYAVHGPGNQTPERVRMFLNFTTKWFRGMRPSGD